MDLSEREPDTVEAGSDMAMSYLLTAMTLGGVMSIDTGRTKFMGKQPHPDKSIGQQMLVFANQEELYV